VNGCKGMPQRTPVDDRDMHCMEFYFMHLLTRLLAERATDKVQYWVSSRYNITPVN